MKFYFKLRFIWTFISYCVLSAFFKTRNAVCNVTNCVAIQRSLLCITNCVIITNCNVTRPYPVIWKTVPISLRINILKLHQVTFCIENITLSKFQGDTRNSFPYIAYRIYIISHENLAIRTWVGTKYCILPCIKSEGTIFKTLWL